MVPGAIAIFNSAQQHLGPQRRQVAGGWLVAYQMASTPHTSSESGSGSVASSSHAHTSGRVASESEGARVMRASQRGASGSQVQEPASLGRRGREGAPRHALRSPYALP